MCWHLGLICVCKLRQNFHLHSRNAVMCNLCHFIQGVYYYVVDYRFVSPSLVSAGGLRSDTQFSFKLNCWCMCLLCRGERVKILCYAYSSVVLQNHHHQQCNRVLFSIQLTFWFGGQSSTVLQSRRNTTVRTDKNEHHI